MKFDAIILGGGKSSRMGKNKALLRLYSKPLLASVAESLSAARQIAVVAPAEIVQEAFQNETQIRPKQVIQTLEDPPFGGPVAGIAAGMQALSKTPQANLVAIFACDLPGAAFALARLQSHQHLVGQSVDGVCGEDPAGRKQWLLGIYSSNFLNERLSALGSVRSVSVREFLKPARLRLVKMSNMAAQDLDSPEDFSLYRNQQLP